MLLHISTHSIDEQDVEGKQADTYEFLQELCYMNHGCVGPLVIENKSHKDDDMYQAVPLAELRYVQYGQ